MKFDLWYLNFGYLENDITCTPDSYMLRNLNFNWQESITNYICLLLFLVIYFILKFLLSRVTKYKWILKIKNLLIISSEYSFLIIWFLIMPWFAINFCLDVFSIGSHYLCSFISIIFILWWFFYWFVNKFYFLKSKFLQKLFRHDNPGFIYASLFFKVPLILLFLSNSSLLNFILMIIILMMHSSILIFFNFNGKYKQNRIQVYGKSIEIFWNITMQLILMIMTIQKVRYFKPNIQ